MIKNILYPLVFILPLMGCPSPQAVQTSNFKTQFTITNNTSDIDIQVFLDSSSSVTLEKGDCVQSSFGNLAKIQVSFKPSVIQLSWLKACKEDNKCSFEEGGWWTLCEAGQCHIEAEQHYEFTGSSTEKQTWKAVSKEPANSCKSL